MKSLLKKVLPHRVQNLCRGFLYGRFYVLQRETDGLLPAKIYERIYNEVRKLPDLDIVEIGGAAGAASIAIGWAMKRDHKKSKLIIVEKCEGGSRAQYGGRQDNLMRLERNLKRFRVTDSVVIFPEYLTFENGQRVLGLLETRQIAAFMLDADGCIHRDFHFFWPRLHPDGLIIVDDYQEARDAKHDLTFHLLNRLMEWGLFDMTDRVGSTVFGRKPPAGDIRRLDLRACEEVVEMVSRKYGVVFEKAGIVNQ